MRRLLTLVVLLAPAVACVPCAPAPGPVEPAPASSTTTTAPSPGEGLEWCVGCVRPIPWTLVP